MTPGAVQSPMEAFLGGVERIMVAQQGTVRRGPGRSGARRRLDRRRTRRGVASILSMMFLVVFSSLTAAMAVVAMGNLRTADSGLKVSRAMSAAETGLVFASRRLATESSRFVIEKGVIEPTYGHELWLGTYNQGADG
ncbi:MAG: hypothetical protein ACYTGR_19485, partial [Planctomycetota bacterium]